MQNLRFEQVRSRLSPAPLRIPLEVKACSAIDLVWSHALGEVGLCSGTSYCASRQVMHHPRTSGTPYNELRGSHECRHALLLTMQRVSFSVGAVLWGNVLYSGGIAGKYLWRFGWTCRRLSFDPSSFHPIAVHRERHRVHIKCATADYSRLVCSSFECMGWLQTQLHSLLLTFPGEKNRYWNI